MNDKTIEVLITTMNLENSTSLLNKMNIQSKAMIGNQCNHNEISLSEYKNYEIPIFSFNEKGVGLNRNNLLMRTKSDFCLFGDDDLIYVDNYEQIILDSFKRYSDADVLIFNLNEEKSTRYMIKKVFKVNKFNYMRFGAARLAIRSNSILLNGIFFNTCFGGGTQFSNGEDTLFLSECLKKNLKIYALPITIANLTNERDSTWFKGYNEKYLQDKGVLFFMISKKFYKLLCLQDALRHSKSYNSRNIFKNYYTMLKGVKKIKGGIYE